MEQAIINWTLGCFGALIGFMLKVVWQAVKDLQTAGEAKTLYACNMANKR
jgi:hypothetical protein